MVRSSEEELVRAVIAGDTTAYGVLYDHFAPLVRAVCYSHTQNLADAQDLAQDVFLRAYQKLGSLQEPSRFGKWLIGIARLRGREWRRTQMRQRARSQELGRVEFDGPDPQNNGHVEQLRRMIAKLPEKERLALHVFYLQERSPEDAQSILGLSRSGFYRALDRARKKLKRLMARELEEIL